MEWKLLKTLLILSLTGENTQSFVSTAPLPNGKLNDNAVKELERLKSVFEETSRNGDEISMTKTRTSFFTDKNGEKFSHQNFKNEVDKNGILVSKVQENVDAVKNNNEPTKLATETEVEIPSAGIHDFFMKNAPNMKANRGNIFEYKQNDVEKNNLITGIEYGPLDMAEYIYWTGDEKNVALMVEEFLDKGLMSRQEAIHFLQALKLDLDLIQAHDKNLHKSRKKNVLNLGRLSSYELVSSSLPDIEKNEPVSNKLKDSFDTDLKPSKITIQPPSRNDYSVEGAERQRNVDIMFKEYSLEEIIYQLAKTMFTQSLGRGSTEAQSTLHKLVTILQTEAKSGHVPKNLEKKLINVFYSALTDTLAEQTEYMFSEKKGLLNNSESFMSRLGSAVMASEQDSSDMQEGLRNKTKPIIPLSHSKK